MFMSSGHWTNTGMAKFINDNLYNYKSDDEKSMNPFRWYRLQNGDDVSKYRETINGFPCRLILINDGSTPLNEGQNEPTPGNTKDMGIFNFNHDKDATKTLGFDNDIFPNCASYEVTANSDTSAGAFMTFKHRYSLNGVTSNFNLRYATSHNMTISDITPLPWTIKSPSRSLVIMRVNNDTTSAIYIRKGETVTITEFPWGTDDVAFRIGDEGSELLTFELNGCIYTLDRFDDGEYVMALTNQSDELAYLKESFELRHPDTDDVAEDWGFMGVEDTVLKIDEFLFYGNIRTSKMEASYFNSDSITITFDNNVNFSFVPTGDNVSPQYDVPSGTTISLEGVDRFNLAAKDWTYVDINGNRYYKGITREEGVATKEENPYESTIFNTSYSLKALIDWVDNCTDEEFVADFEEHFHKDYTLRYFCLVTLLGAVDNLGGQYSCRV